MSLVYQQTDSRLPNEVVIVFNIGLEEKIGCRIVIGEMTVEQVEQMLRDCLGVITRNYTEAVSDLMEKNGLKVFL